MTFFDKNIDLKVEKICRKKYEQLILDHCYDKGKIYIVEDPNITADNLRIINLADGIDQHDAVNVKQIQGIDDNVKKLRMAQLSCLSRYCTIDLRNIDGLIDGLKALCSYTMIFDYDSIPFLNQYDVEVLDNISPVLKHMLILYEIEYEEKEFTIDEMYEYVEKISNKLQFKILK